MSPLIAADLIDVREDHNILLEIIMIIMTTKISTAVI